MSGSPVIAKIKLAAVSGRLVIRRRDAVFLAGIQWEILAYDNNARDRRIS